MFLRIFFLSVFLLFTSLFGKDSDLLLHISFDNDDTVEEMKSNLENCSLTARARGELDYSKAELVPGIHGQALHLKAGNLLHYHLPARTLTDLQPPFTIALWAKKTERLPEHGILCATAADAKDFGFELSWFWRRAIFRWGKKNATVSSEGASLLINHWYHIAVTHDGKTVTLYIDAIPQAEKEVEVPMNPTKPGYRFTVGQFPTAFDAYPHVGMIDDIFVLSRALDKNEIADLATNSK